ncbi:MAG: endopeptidase La [bacterium]
MAGQAKKSDKKSSERHETLPLIPLRNIVVFPQMIVPLFIGRSLSLKALEETIEREKMIVFASQHNEEDEDPEPKDIAKIGTLAEIIQLMALPDGTTKILVEGICRVRLTDFTQTEPFFRVAIRRMTEPEEITVKAEALVRTVIKSFEQYVKLNPRIPAETLMSIVNVDSPGKLADLVASYLSLRLEDKQSILEAVDVEKRLKQLVDILEKEIEVLGVEKKLQGKVRHQIEKVQKEYYLKEKLRAIQEELGEEEDLDNPEVGEYKRKITKAKLPDEVKDKALKELARLKHLPPMGSEVSVIKTYLDWLVEMPWKRKSKSRIDINEVEKILNEDHFGLEKVKERILEYFAVRQLTGKMGGTILCLVGAPGVGKTSVARSIARAMGRKLARISLGGVRDEAEIRGHRRTYVGSLPGRIIQSIHKAKVKNPVFLLDEVDKLGNDFRGDPAAALLEVLDPEMNKEFSDHYLEVAFDLSDVFFITTANLREPIPRPLLDRMEVIQMSGYTEKEKLEIAKGYLIKRELERHGLTADKVEFSEEALMLIIGEYTREAGVRNLEREIAKVLRKVATHIVKTDSKEKVVVEAKDLTTYLGAAKYRFGLAEETDQIGTATGLAWTEVGGDTLPVEVTVLQGRGNLTLTGQMGDVMQESAKAAMSCVRARAQKFGLEENFYRRIDVHIHVPEGAVPKDGPSAGIAIATALTSALTKIPVKKSVAMTGEITLRGRALPIGGLKEKLLAARRAGIKTVIIPDENQRNYDEIKNEIPADLEIKFVKDLDEVLELALAGKLWEKTEEEVIKKAKDDGKWYLPPSMQS